ncbi:MAG: RNA-binding S4 domain-containing protein [Clostridiales Family XIII bacterium]|nr:RNA-binding S4 domain-containing protein [Clostridiales Family XIII bacterium]
MRIDKFLKNSRLIKRRAIAKEACDRERVFINGRPAKPGAEVKIGDTVLVRFGNGETEVRVTALLDSARKEDAASMYEPISR